MSKWGDLKRKEPIFVKSRSSGMTTLTKWLNQIIAEGDSMAEKVKQYESFFNVERITQIKVDEKKLVAIRKIAGESYNILSDPQDIIDRLLEVLE